MTGPMKYEELRRAHAGEALTNWITGHQGLFVLCRELERSLKLMERAISADNHVATARQFQRFSSITRACAVAFKVAGNMSRNDYEKHVVVPMLGVDEAFTGLWARDHSSMLQQLRSTFAKLRGFEAERAAIKMLTAVMVKQHERVCERFAKGRPSLNAQARSGMAADRPEGYLLIRERFGPRHVQLIDS
ncbi:MULTISPECIES: hypothetical protein [unclassified Bradyrhizobium]|uniref:hypothetical protein n=1 Tax=unclassified Bradyrhizobium TaxID=2631580 RepID=UPI001CD5A6F7|nr:MULTISPECIES: hypothetical protein [unclassified Bradyrhizobium]MCA1393332.1 hypothetical protein [Bradyrhizobium sp. IC3123]MCA1438454.1 hypothetical protein [Bradyrhizobium sp. BRP20]MCA1473302.1 hypothetical protein [Bradyrhizobium sp. IC3195]MCA1502154.1 hypothetical protein [Bradyrhizobium sp. NBAIM14]MCA1552490.1 hypothetical protein [Bradyrhizobium sp. BRP19]